jgi:hypothetical protein
LYTPEPALATIECQVVAVVITKRHQYLLTPAYERRHHLGSGYLTYRTGVSHGGLLAERGSGTLLIYRVFLVSLSSVPGILYRMCLNYRG